MSEAVVNDYAPVSVEDSHGRVLTGVGVSAESLQATIDSRSPDADPQADGPAEGATTPTGEDGHQAAAAAQPTTPRDDTGKFTKPSRADKRIQQLAGQRDTEKARADKLAAELAEFKQKVESFESARRAPQPPAQTPPSTAAPTETAGLPSAGPSASGGVPGEPNFEQDYEAAIGTKYSSYGQAVQAFQRDHIAWTLSNINLDAQIRGRIEADRASRAQQDAIAQSATEARQAYQDFDAVLGSDVAQANIWTADKLQAIASHPQSGHVRYHLAKNPQIAWQLSQAHHPQQFGYLLGQFLASVLPSSAPAVASPASTASRVQFAPPPMQPVGSGARTTVPPSSDLVKGHDFDSSGYRERRAAERGMRRMK